MSFMGEQAAQEGDLGELTERTISLVEQLASLRYECASCWNVVKHDVAIFTCKVCFCIFHLYCMKKWARQAESGEGTSFRCPHCQTQHGGPLKYFCFCGKLRDPPHDPQITPHSCGQPCEKPRGHGCPHLCSLRCHPGPCPPCAAPPERKLCGCGATAYVLRCGEPDSNKTCGGICAKTLSCGKHTCKSICHRGQCAECSWRVTTTCYCGAVEEERACGSKGFSCGRMCGERLECGAHFCTAACHAGPCNACERDPVVVTTCPCGATTLSATRLKCTDPIPTCGKVCARPLDCGQHTCEMLCHEGPCKPCNRRVSTRCVCKLTQATVPCAERDKYRCAKICKTKFSCGKHDCRARCCPYRNDSEASAHRCKKVCNRKLPCGHHCLEECHRGLCPACPHVVAERLQCRCGAEVLMPPQPCGTGPPVCSRPCAATRPCKHTVAEHNCHYGDCPHACIQ
ncbi:hypothetical protein TRVL_04887 [Trypanosoma vivax]|nr:hypothetical protein TRVL_04887 [Trypanosoma vivax]